MARREKDILKWIWQNFMKSFSHREKKGNFMGEDRYGNKFFEVPADPSIGKRKPRRYFESKVDDRFDAHMVAEWEAWLRLRREVPPTPEELQQNFETMQQTKSNAAEKGYINPKFHEEKTGSFPRHKDFEMQPGESRDWKKHEKE